MSDQNYIEARSDGPILEKKHQFGLIESVFLISANLIADAFEFLGVTGIGVFFGMILDFFITPATLLYLFFKGTPRVIGKNALMQVLEFFPYIDILPFRTTIIILTILGANHPQTWGKIIGLANAKVSVSKR